MPCEIFLIPTSFTKFVNDAKCYLRFSLKSMSPIEHYDKIARNSVKENLASVPKNRYALNVYLILV